MNIIFLTRHDPNDIKKWSGTLWHIYNKLKEKHHVEVIGSEVFRQLSVFAMGNLSTEALLYADRYFLKQSNVLSERINSRDFDLVFFGSLFFTPLNIDIPFVHVSDLNCRYAQKHYLKTEEKFIKTLFEYEEELLTSSFRIIYCSEWIKQEVIEQYHLDPDKIDVVDFGANIPTPTTYSIEINTDICRLVFIGKDWERKGGDMLMKIFKLLKKDGFPCELTIIGSKPPDYNDCKDLTVYPSLDKSKPADLKILCKVLSESHFLVLPTKFDAFGIVFCEASAYGVPSISANVGGVSQAIKEGENGYLLPADATASDYAEKIKDVFSDRQSYFKLRKSSRNEFETRLNWDVWGDKVNRILEDAVRDWNYQKNKT